MRLIQEAGMNFIYDDNGTFVMKSKVKNEHRSMSESEIVASIVGPSGEPPSTVDPSVDESESTSEE